MTLSAFAGGQLFGRRFGDGPARVLALHGWSRTHADFDSILGATSTGGELDAISLDLPGFGASPTPPAAWGAAQYAAEVSKILEQMQKPVIIVAHSFGGRVAVHMAQQQPDHISGLVLTGVPLLRKAGPPSKAPLTFRLGKKLHKLGLIPDSKMEDLRNRFGSADYNAATGVMRDVLVTVVNETYEEQLAAISCPVDLVWGAADTAAPVEVAERASSILANSELTVVGDADHFLPLTHADVVRDAIETQLRAGSHK